MIFGIFWGVLRPVTLLFWFTRTALMMSQAAVSSKKALKTHCTLSAQHQTADRHNWQLHGEHSGALSS